MATTDEGNLVLAAVDGDSQAFGRLFDAWFDRVHDLSRRIVHDDGIAGEVAQDVFLTAWTKLRSLEDPDAFGGWLLRIARNASLNRLAKERRSVVLDDEAMTTIRDADAPDDDPLARLDQAGRIALVWDAAAALGERDASVLDLHLRHGLTAAELAEELGVTPNNAHQVLFTLRKRLGNSVRALVLWRAGRPTCADLRQALAADGHTSFGAPMVKAIDRHVDACATCSQDRSDRVAPVALFAAAPIVAAPILLKANAASALEAAGIPMSGSTVAPGTGTGSPGSAGPQTGSGSSQAGSGGAAAAGIPTAQVPAVAGASDEPPEPLDGDGRRARSGDRRRYAQLSAAALVVLVLVAGLLWADRSGDDDEPLRIAAAPTTTGGVATSTSVSEAPPATVVTGSTEPGSDPTQPTTPPPTQPTVAPTTTIPAPTIDSFDATPVAYSSCKETTTWNVSWSTTGADAVTVGPTGAAGQPYGPDGSATFCAPDGTTFVLDATGPGGTTSATAGGGSAPTTTAPPTTTTTGGVIG